MNSYPFCAAAALTVGYLAPDPREIPISRRTKYLNDTPNVMPALKRTGLF